MSNIHSLKKVIRLLIVPLLFTGLYGYASGNQYKLHWTTLSLVHRCFPLICMPDS